MLKWIIKNWSNCSVVKRKKNFLGKKVVWINGGKIEISHFY